MWKVLNKNRVITTHVCSRPLSCGVTRLYEITEVLWFKESPQNRPHPAGLSRLSKVDKRKSVLLIDGFELHSNSLITMGL